MHVALWRCEWLQDDNSLEVIDSEVLLHTSSCCAPPERTALVRSRALAELAELAQVDLAALCIVSNYN